MPRSSCITKKRNKAAKSRNSFIKRTRVLEAIQNSDIYVPEDAHLDYFSNLPQEVLPDLHVEVENINLTSVELSGNRIVDIAFFIQQMQIIRNHDRVCTVGEMVLVKEIRNGFLSLITFKCTVCLREVTIRTHPSNKLNDAFVWGISSIGSGYAQSEELFSVLNIPIMTKKTYKASEGTVHHMWEELLVKQMKENAEEEKKIAIENGNIEHDIPFITVVVDGGWAKRSYGHSFSALSGVACIIGQKTKKLLYISVKNKFCYVCATSKKNHVCYKNYEGSSTSMEQNIIVEGFNKSEKDYGLRYKYFIGDGDSSVYTRILENVSYGRYVIKLECANHVTRAFTSNLYKLTKNTSFDIKVRNILKSKIPKLGGLVRTIIARTRDINLLRIDLKNCPKHVFGDHNSCRTEVCTKKTLPIANEVPLLESSKIFCEILKVSDSVIRKSDRLCKNVTTNYAERYMSVIAKFTGGKRTNLIQRGVYRFRCFGAGLAYNWGPSFHKLISPNNCFLERLCRRRQQKKHSIRKQKHIKIQDDDMDYGSNCAEPDLSLDNLEIAKQKIISSLVVNTVDLEKCTIGQRNNIIWHETRRNRITASYFGRICLRRSSTHCHNLIKDMFYKNADIKSKSIQYGIENETLAIRKFEEQFNIKVRSCGFFVSPEYNFLGASPDGVTEYDELVEVKCLYSIKDKTIKNSLKEYKNACVMLDSNNTLKLKEKHQYNYQIQGQLNITKKLYCYLILYTDVDLEVLKIEKNETFWNNIMLPKLTNFWDKCVLPELADPRIPRGLKVRNHNYTR